MSTGIIVAIALLVGFLVLSRVFAGPRIDGEQARAHVADGALLVDVRSPGEFASGHIEGAKNIPHTDVEQRLDEFGATEDPIVLYCASGMRSAHAARVLRSSGFEQVYDLGPKSAW